MSHSRIPAVAVAALLALSLSVGATAQSNRQTRMMKHCNVEANARHLMGRDRMSFMQTCLSGPRGRHLALNSQQRRMRDCSARAKAKGLKGSEHQRFMSSCLRMR